jgi:hypothetical protein
VFAGASGIKGGNSAFLPYAWPHGRRARHLVMIAIKADSHRLRV